MDVDGVHVEIAGSGPAVLCVHGSGSSGHSWAALARRLDGRFTLLAPDLPGHGRSRPPAPGSFGVGAMARSMARLLDALQLKPAFLFGHSAGAAVIGQMVVDRLVAPQGLVLVNPALLPPRGLQRLLFPVTARGLAGAGWFAPLVARRARRDGAVERLLHSVGTRTGPDGIGVDGVTAYRRLLSDRDHVASVVRMMAEWDLAHLLPALARRRLPALVISGARDGAVMPAEIGRLATMLPWACFVELPGVGHLAQEEAPAEVARSVTGWVDGLGAPEALLLEAQG